VSELADTIRDALRALHASDRTLARFGAARHRYELAPPNPHRKDLPPDLAEFVTTIGASGAGPGYGFLGVDHVAPRKGIVVAHLGCGYAAVVAMTGEIWIDAQAIGVTKPIAPSFTAWYLDWIERLAHNTLPESHIPPGLCPLPNALSGFLAMHEQQQGVAAGTLAGDPLRQALAELGPHSIEIAAESSLLFATGTRVDPCIACAALVENLRPDGLRADVIKPGA
jgi:hypothetical protein